MKTAAKRTKAHPEKRGDRFELVGEDMVIDHSTGLRWSRGNVPGGRMNWKAANDACAAMDLGGLKWRAPVVGELLTIVDYTRSSPAINPIFRCEPAWYWTATPWAGSPGVYAWFVNVNGGSSNYFSQDLEFFVRAVCASQ
jgi:hypothetical protein